MSNTTPAWLLHVADNIQFSIAEHEAAEYLEAPMLHKIPVAKASCNHVIFWHDMIVPVIDMNIFFAHPAATNYQHIIVTAYQENDNERLQYIAFVLASAPEKIVVNDNDACEIPENYPEILKPHVLSSFSYNNQATSIFDIAQLSSSNFQS